MPIPEEKYRRKNPGTARFLTLIVPGLGHLYARQFLGGCITLLIVAPIHFLFFALVFNLFGVPYLHRVRLFSAHGGPGHVWLGVLFWLQKDAAERCMNYNMRLSLKEEKERKAAYLKNNPFGEKSLEP